MDKEYIFLFESPHGWGSVWQRPHHLVSRIAKKFKCHYIYSQYLKNILKEPKMSLRYRSKGKEIENLQIHNLTLINGERFPIILKHNRNKMTALFKKISEKYPQQKKVLWIYNPHNGFLREKIPHDICVYDIMDEYSGFPWSPPKIKEEEQALLKNADIVFAGTEALYNAKKETAAGKIKRYISGVEFDHFHKSTQPETKIPDDILEIKKKSRLLLGYTGMTDMRVDEESIKHAAMKNPDVGFVLIGPVVGDFTKIKNLPNVHFLGQRPYSQLPNYLKAFDCCLIPFVLNKLTMHINPTKILEYFAAEKYVITAKIPDVVKLYPDCVGFFSTPEEFAQRVSELSTSPEIIAQKTAAAIIEAHKNSWDERVEKMLKDTFDSVSAKK